MRSEASPGKRQGDLRRRYQQMRPGWEPAAVIYRRFIAQAMPPAGRALDLGCGRKDFPIDLRDGRLQLMGVDADVDALTGQGSAARAAARGERLPFGDDTFDLVCCAWVLEHVEHPRTFATEVHRVLKPGGRIVFVTPNAWNAVTWMIRAIPNPLHPLIMRRLQRRHEHDTYPVRYRMNTWRSIDGILAGAGLVRERLLLNGDPTYMAFGSRSLRVTAATERLLDLPGLKNARVHLIGVYRKPLGPAMDR